MRVKTMFLLAADSKYRQGARNNGNNLLSLTALELCDEAIAECLDQFIYLQRQREILAAQSPRRPVENRAGLFIANRQKAKKLSPHQRSHRSSV